VRVDATEGNVSLPGLCCSLLPRAFGTRWARLDRTWHAFEAIQLSGFRLAWRRMHCRCFPVVLVLALGLGCSGKTEVSVSGGGGPMTRPPGSMDASIDALAVDAELDAGVDAETDARSDAGAPPISDPEAGGPFEVLRRSYLFRFASARSVAIEVSSPVGLIEAPMVFFVRGTSAIGGFESLSEHLASHGLLVVQPVRTCLDGSSTCTHTERADDAISLSQYLRLEWADVGLSLQPTAIGFLGHGSGGKVAALAAGTWESPEAALPPAFLMMPDNSPPRDGYSAASPDGHRSAPEIRRLAVFGSGVMGICEDQDYLLRQGDFERASGQVVWEWFAERSHWMDFVSEPEQCGSDCAVCEGRRGSDRVATQRALRRYTAAFFRFTLGADVAAERWLAEVDVDGMLMARYPGAAL